jgi:DNA-binding SARP family transcriptional activator
MYQPPRTVISRVIRCTARERGIQVSVLEGGSRTADVGGGHGAWLRLLGGFSLSLAGTPVSLPVNGQRLLAYLSIRGQVPRPVVAGTLWPDVSEHNAHGSLRTTMWRLHRGGTRLVEATGENLSLNPHVTVDIRVFAKAAQRALRSPVLLDEVGSDGDLLEASDLLPGWYDDWVIFERERLRQLRLHTLEALAQRLAEQRRFAAALDTALEAIRIEPLRESAHRVVIGIHQAEGNVVEAVRHYHFVRDLLRVELGVEPSGQLTAMLPAATLSRGPGAGGNQHSPDTQRGTPAWPQQRMVTRLDMVR